MVVETKNDYIPCHLCKHSSHYDFGVDYWADICKQATIRRTGPEGESGYSNMDCWEAIEFFRNKYGKCPYFEKHRLTKISEFFVNLFKR